MQNTAFLHWLRSLHKEDMPAFRQFLQQPQNVAKKLPCALFEYMQRFEDAWREQKTIDAPVLGEQQIYRHLYPTEPLKPQRLRRVMMDLRELIEAFAATRSHSLLSPSLDMELRKLRYLLERDSPLFLERLEALSAQLEQTELSDELPLARMRIEQMRTQHAIHHRLPDDTFEQALAHLDEFYLLVKLETWTAMRSRENQHVQRHRYPHVHEINQLAASASAQGKTMVALWQAMFALVSQIDAQVAYPAAMKALEEVGPRLQQNTLRQVRAYLFNAINRSGNTDNRAFFQRLHELLHTMLLEGTLHLSDGRLPHTFYLPYVRAACLSGNTDLAEAFIQNHSHNLVSTDIPGLVGYCKALLTYCLGQPQQSLKILLALKSTESRTEVQLRILHVQVAYSLADEDNFFRTNEALRKFLDRHTELGERFQALVKHFAQFADSLARIRFGHNRPSGTLRKRIELASTAEKLWLLTEESKVAKP